MPFKGELKKAMIQGRKMIIYTFGNKHEGEVIEYKTGGTAMDNHLKLLTEEGEIVVINAIPGTFAFGYFDEKVEEPEDEDFGEDEVLEDDYDDMQTIELKKLALKKKLMKKSDKISRGDMIKKLRESDAKK